MASKTEYSQKWEMEEGINLFYNIGEVLQGFYIYSHKNIHEELLNILRFGKNDIISKLSTISEPFILVFSKGEHLFILTDRFGKIPLFWYSSNRKFQITTDLNGKIKIKYSLLNPSLYVKINMKSTQVQIIDKLPINHKATFVDEKQIVQLLAQVSEATVLKSIKGYQKISLLYSGGVDSSIIAQILKRNNIPFIGYVVGDLKSHDVIAAKINANLLGIELKLVPLSESMIEDSLFEIEQIVQTGFFSNIVKTVPRVVLLEVAIVLYHGIKKAVFDKSDVILTAIGTEELFMGFSLEARHLDPNKTLEEISKEKFDTIYTRDLYKDYRLASYFKCDMKAPFICSELYKIALNLPTLLKVNNGIKKYIWRRMGESLGLPPKIAFQNNKATQFGSCTSKLLSRVAKKQKFKYKKNYIEYLLK
ncbi:MAG: hypothetical protein EAX86_03570 [Candidatus Heimdallarchaeota archaeon]|nr:hypothetical protein [Candidatus Heimdallarchaeota archaeon]